MQILQKRAGKNFLIETIGCSSEKKELEILEKNAQSRIQELFHQQSLKFSSTERDEIISEYLNKSQTLQVQSVGAELIIGKIFDSIGLSKIPEEMFRHIVLARLTHPVSKLKTTQYLAEYHRIDVDISAVYRFLDKFNHKYKEQVERIIYEHSQKIIGKISVVFYDMTTLYFEAEDEDDLRKIGFSKDGKFQCPQIMIGLLVGENGYPIAYDMFVGNTFEGHTIIPVIASIQNKYNLPKPIIIADSGLLSNDNIKQLLTKNYEFVLGARIRNENEKIKQRANQQPWIQ